MILKVCRQITVNKWYIFNDWEYWNPGLGKVHETWTENVRQGDLSNSGKVSGDRRYANKGKMISLQQPYWIKVGSRHSSLLCSIPLIFFKNFLFQLKTNWNNLIHLFVNTFFLSFSFLAGRQTQWGLRASFAHSSIQSLDHCPALFCAQ